MKLKLIIFSLVLIPIFLHGQSKSSVDLIGSADYVYRNLSSDAEDPNSVVSIPDLIDFMDDHQKGRLKARFGFNYNRKINQKLFLKSGLRLATVGYITDSRASSFDLEVAKLSTEHLFLEVPLVFRYEVLQVDKISLFIEVGFSPNIYLSTRTKNVTNGEITEDPLDFASFGAYNRLHWVGSVSPGLNHTLNDNWQLFGQSIFRYHFTRLINDSQFPMAFNILTKERLYSIGFELGIRRFLN